VEKEILIVVISQCELGVNVRAAVRLVDRIDPSAQPSFLEFHCAFIELRTLVHTASG
jgi:hypothetical protein